MRSRSGVDGAQQKVRRPRRVMAGLIVAISVDSALILLSVPASPVVALVASGLGVPLIAGAVAVQTRLAREGAPYRWPWNDPH